MGNQNKSKKYVLRPPEPSEVHEEQVAFEYTAGGQEMVERALEGVDVVLFDLICDRYRFDPARLAEILGITERTVRNYRDQGKKFAPDQSEKLMKMRQLLHKGVEVFGDIDSLHRWLAKPAYGFKGTTPVALLITSEGINLVIDEIDRIAYGDLA